MNLLHNVLAGQSRKFLLRFSNLNPVEGMEAFGGDIRASARATWYPRGRHMVCYVNTCSLEDKPKGIFCDVKGVLTSQSAYSLYEAPIPVFCLMPRACVVEHMLIYYMNGLEMPTINNCWSNLSDHCQSVSAIESLLSSM